MKTKTHIKPMLAETALVLTAVAGVLVTPAWGQESMPRPFIPGTVFLDAPDTGASIHLKPWEDEANFDYGKTNPWYCYDYHGLDQWSAYVDNVWRMWHKNIADDRARAYDSFKEQSDAFLSIKGKGVLDFWSGATAGPLYFELQPDAVKLSPTQGQSVTRSIANCYSMAELETGKREAVRWATYMKNVWLPANKQ